MDNKATKKVWLYILVGAFFLLAIFLAFFIWKQNTKKDKGISTTVIEESENSSKTEKN